jgi:hypothetical protein
MKQESEYDGDSIYNKYFKPACRFCFQCRRKLRAQNFSPSKNTNQNSKEPFFERQIQDMK